MAYDQNALPNSLRPIHIARTPVDESRITPVTLPNSNPLPREVAASGSPGTVPVYYPSTAPAVPDSGYVGLSYGNVVPAVVNWLPRVPPPAAAAAPGVSLVSGYGYGNSAGLGQSGYNTNNPNLAPSGGSNASDHTSEESGEDSVSGRKVKFLCSYGGKILPRPSDGVLRYVGGDTRIISVRRDVGFNELMQKLFDSYGRNVVIKYQLPGEDLDALVSVSRPEDLENMMDEYDKLAERSSDGSAKLRVFLFSDLESSSVIRFKDLQAQLHNNVIGIGVTPHQYITPSSHVSFSPNPNPVPVQIPTQAPAPVQAQPPAQAPPQYVQQREVVMEHFPGDPSYSTYQPQTQISPQVIPGAYGWNQVPAQEQVSFSESRVPAQQLVYPEPVPRFDGCIMCQKALPHAHSDTLAQERKESPRSTVSDVNPVYQSLKFEDTRRMMQPNRVPGDPAIQVSTPYGVLVQQSAVPMQYQVNQEPVVNKVVSGDSNPVRVPSPTSDTQVHESPREYDNLRQIEARMEDLRLRPHDVLVNADQSSFHVKNPQDEILENRPMNLDKSQMVVDPNYTASEVPWLHGFQSVGPGGASNMGVNDPSPPFSGSDSAREVETVLIDPLNPFNGAVVESQDGANSLFSNQDPWMLRHDSQFPPPRPTKLMPKKEGVAAKEESPTSDALIDDGPYQTTANSDLNFGVEHGSAEELIKQELQAVAEGVAASVLRSSTPTQPDLNKHSSEANLSGEAQNSNEDAQSGVEVEDLKTKIPEKTNFGFPVSDGLGSLQIIKNSDLEELRELGSGTFGTVYHGKWRGSDVAIKRINDRCFAGKASEQERMREDFWNEAIKLADLHHPNVVAFYGVVLDGPGGSVATVTEYMVNGSLRNALQKNERNLDKRKRLLIAMDVAFGMEYLHGKNIVHFDLKSDNLLVNLRDPHRPICKVGDLGLSKVKRQTLISGGVRGTLPWMAPELLNGSSSLVSEKVDVFSFGIVMWELLTGDEPYTDLHYGAIIGGIVSNTLRPPVPDGCDPEWRSLMERCWSAEPSERPSFTEIANQLRTVTSKVPPKGIYPWYISTKSRP
ncbi:putative protein kinase TKL-Pl-6 family [Helianthus debilis subsp. tardiflorus]